MDTARFIQMANKVPLYSFALINRRLWQFSLHRHVSKPFQCNSAKENPYMKKYTDKIASVQGIPAGNVQILTEKPLPKHQNQQKYSVNRSHTDGEQSSSSCSPHPKIGQKTLDSIMKLELLNNKTAEEIESIWKQYFGGKDGLYAVVPSATYHKIISKSEEFPTFLYPVPKESGYVFILGQFRGNSCYFTPLQDYQMHQDKAHPGFTVTYYPELIEDKGIALMRGEFDDKVLQAQEAQCLANQLQLYYGGNNSKKQELLSIFNKDPLKFEYMDLIAELETGLS